MGSCIEISGNIEKGFVSSCTELKSQKEEDFSREV
jgi:hypothetical protein